MLMLQQSASEEGNSVATPREVAFIFVAFAVVLYLLYPKEMLYKQVLLEKSNYALTSVYVENMLRLEPENVDLVLAAIELSLKNKNPDLAEKLLEALRSNHDPIIVAKVNRYRYEVFTVQRRLVATKERKWHFTQMMKGVLSQTAKTKQYTKEDALIWFQNGLKEGQKKEALSFLDSLELKDPLVLEQCIYLSAETKNEGQKKGCLEQLMKIENKKSLVWLLATYRVQTHEGNTLERLNALKEIVKHDPQYLYDFAQVSSLAGDYREASATYMKLYEATTDEKKRKELLILALEVLAYNALKGDAVALAQRYEESYIGDKEMTNKLITLYLGMGSLQEANNLSKKLLKRGL